MRRWPSIDKRVILIAIAAILCVIVMLAFKYHWYAASGGVAAAGLIPPLGFGDGKKAGFLEFNPPSEMRQGHIERIKVAITRPGSLEKAFEAHTIEWRKSTIRIIRAIAPLLALLVEEMLPDNEGHAESASKEAISTSRTMGVDLKGSDAFEITPLSEREQGINNATCWYFDVQPIKTGTRYLTLCAYLRLERKFLHFSPGHGETVSLPPRQRKILVRFDVRNSWKRFISNNWQWLAAFIAGLAGVITTWIALFH